MLSSRRIEEGVKSVGVFLKRRTGKEDSSKECDGCPERVKDRSRCC